MPVAAGQTYLAHRMRIRFPLRSKGRLSLKASILLEIISLARWELTPTMYRQNEDKSASNFHLILPGKIDLAFILILLVWEFFAGCRRWHVNGCEFSVSA
jgi:hypothetical protein